MQIAASLTQLTQLKQELESRPDDEGNWLLYIGALAAVGRAQEALGVIGQAIQYGYPSDRFAQLTEQLRNRHDAAGKLVALFGARQFETLKQEIDAWLIALPDDGFAWKLLGATFAEQAQFDAALAPLLRAIELNPGDAETHVNLSNVCLALERVDEAAAYLQASLVLTPNNGEITAKLGFLLARTGKPEEAEIILQRAMALCPSNADVRLTLGNILFGRRDWLKAEEMYRAAIALDPSLADAYNNLAGCLQEQRRFEEAEVLCRQSLVLSPDFPDAHNNLGVALNSLERFKDAESTLLRAIELRPSYAEAYLNLGIALKEQDRFPEAQIALRRSLELRPDYCTALCVLAETFDRETQLPLAQATYERVLALDANCALALLGLGNLQIVRGQFVDAEVSLLRALSIEPDLPAAVAALAHTRKITPDDSDWLARAEAIAATHLPPKDAAVLGFALGKAHDDIGSYDQAFAHYQKANLSAMQHGPRYNASQYEATTDAIINTYSAEKLGRISAGSSLSARPLFILGMPRSGTSLTEQIIASHGDCFGAGELRFWREAALRCGPRVPGKTLEEQQISALTRECFANLDQHSTTALRVVDKMPGNFSFVGLIHTVFPNARILHTLRNPIDTCLSIYFQNFNEGHEYAKDLHDLAHRYRQYHRLMSHWRQVLPPGVLLDVPYDLMIEDQEGWSRKIIDFIGLEWDDNCLQFHTTERKVGTASNWQVRQPIYKSSKQRWRNYEKYVTPLLPLLELYDPARGIL